MKVRSSIKAICKDCYTVKRGKTRFVYCKKHPKHKQRQGFHSQVEFLESQGQCFCCGVVQQLGAAVDHTLSSNSSLRGVFPTASAMLGSRSPASINMHTRQMSTHALRFPSDTSRPNDTIAVIDNMRSECGFANGMMGLPLVAPVSVNALKSSIENFANKGFAALVHHA